MREIGYYNGEIGDLAQMKIPMQDRALYFGDGVYDVTFAYDRRIFALDDHLDRFYRSLQMMEIRFPLSREALAAEIRKCVEAAETDGGLMLYWQSSRSNSRRNHVFPPASDPPTLLITVTGARPLDYSKDLKLITLEDTRFFHCDIKTLNLIPNVIASQRAKEAGCDEAVLHRGKQLTECAHSSLLILKDGVLRAPKRNELVLPSITRKHLFETAAQLGIPTEERDISMAEVFDADEIIVCSTSKLCAAACRIDEKPVGGKDRETFKKLQHTYFQRIKDEIGLQLTY